MELDELKNLWEQQTPADVDVHNKKIIDMLQSKSYGPLSELKRVFKRAFLMIPLLALMIIYSVINKEAMKDTSLWILVFAFIPICIFYIHWYNMIAKLQIMELPLKEKIADDIVKIERGLKGLHIFMSIVVLILIIYLLEFRNQSHSVLFSKWNLVPIYLRYIAYIALGCWTFFSGKKTNYLYFGRHLDALRHMLSQME